MLTLHLQRLSTERVRGCYTIRGVPDRMPDRSLFLHPSAAPSFLELADRLVVSDLFRSAEASLEAVRARRGAKPPGYSGHNFGLSTDVDVAATIKRAAVKDKAALDAWMESHGWYCHRRDHLITPLRGESHHFNYLGIGTAILAKSTSTSANVEARIIELYGSDLSGLDAMEIQASLQTLRMYSGAIDGQIGPISKEAIRVFQRAWGLVETGEADAITQRTLALVAAEKDITP